MDTVPPFAASDPPDPAVERQLLFDFVNDELEIFASDGLREVFYQKWRIDGRKATPQTVERFRLKVDGYLRLLASKRKLPNISITRTATTDGHGKRTLTLPPNDWGGRILDALLTFARSRAAVRACAECERWFRPVGRDRYCDRCKTGTLVGALRTEKLEQRVIKSQHRPQPLSTTDKQQLCRSLEERLRQLAATDDPRVYAEIGKITNRLATLKRQPPPGMTVHVHGIRPEDVQLPRDPSTLASTVEKSVAVATPQASDVIYPGLSSRELLEQYRKPARHANTARIQKNVHRR